MRDIKFRGWIRGQKRMIPPVTLDEMHKRWSFPIYWVDLMQYTGVKDKKGKEIYEADLVKFEIVMNKGSVEEYVKVYECPVVFIKGCYFVGDWLLSEIDCEVIGNIYEILN